MKRWFWAFGSGGWICVRENFAIKQSKLLVAAIYPNFTTSIVDAEGIEQLDFLIAAAKGGKLI